MIPYIIVLIFVGKPIYFLEMVMGQFSSRGSVKGATFLSPFDIQLHVCFFNLKSSTVLRQCAVSGSGK